MPYIKTEDRKLLQTYTPSTAGELNYTFTLAIMNYIKTKGESYQTYNDIIGALEGAKLELVRRKVNDYEDIKIQANGDVYE